MERKMETTGIKGIIEGLYKDYIGFIYGFIWNVLGSYRDNGKENGNYYILYWGSRGIMEKNTETTI